MADHTSDASKRLMGAKLGDDTNQDAGNPGKTDAPAGDKPVGGDTVALPPGDVPSLDTPKDELSKTVKAGAPSTEDEDVKRPEADDASDKDKSGSGDAGGSGGDKPPAPPSGGGTGGDDDKKPSRAEAEIIDLLRTALVHVAIFPKGSDHIRESDRNVVDLTNALKLATAGPMTDDDYEKIKKLLLGLLGPLEGMANTIKEVAARGNNAKAHELLKKLGFRQ